MISEQNYCSAIELPRLKMRTLPLLRPSVASAKEGAKAAKAAEPTNWRLADARRQNIKKVIAPAPSFC
jgi:hypothetical protein